MLAPMCWMDVLEFQRKRQAVFRAVAPGRVQLNARADVSVAEAVSAEAPGRVQAQQAFTGPQWQEVIDSLGSSVTSAHRSPWAPKEEAKVQNWNEREF